MSDNSGVYKVKVAETAFMKLEKVAELLDEIQDDVAQLQHDKRMLKEGLAAAAKALNGDIITAEEGASLNKAIDML